MNKPKIYLETTVFNYYFDKDRDAHADTVRLFNEIKAGAFEAFTSDYVVEELEQAPESKKSKMIGLLSEYNITILAKTNETRLLADKYVNEDVIPKKFKTDGLHIASATVENLDIIISLNFRHIVKRNTLFMTSAINVANGYQPIEIYSPMEVVNNEETK